MTLVVLILKLVVWWLVCTEINVGRQQ